MNFSRPSIGFYSPVAFDPIITTRNGFRFLDIDDVLMLTIRLAFTYFDNFPPIKINTTIFETKNPIAIELLNREFSIRRKKISDLLIPGINGELKISENISNSEVKTLFSNMDSLYSLKKIVRETISPMLLSDDYALYGKELLLDLPNSYIVANDNEGPYDLLMQAIAKRDLFQKIENEQEVSSVLRKNFQWNTNPFLVPIRRLYASQIKELVASHHFVFGEFDLSMQLLMHLGAYEINKVWRISESLTSQLSRLTETEACAEFEHMVNEGVVIPNNSIIIQELARLADELDTYFSGLYVDIDETRINLPSSYMCDMNFSPFTNTGAHTELVLTDREFVDGPNGKTMTVHEKLSGKKIIFSPVSPAISVLYSRGFCNLHYANPGEIAVYGAFIEGEDLPFAYSSYGWVSYNYTKEMLAYLGYKDGEIIESSRAWNAAWAPENTISVLFSYSQERLRETFGDSIRGIITSINPNLGFSASAFRGIHFETVSLKPTVFSYQLEGGKPYFKPKGEIAKNLGIEISALSTSRYYTDNKIPFLPTIELLYLYDKDERKKLIESPIYVVSKSDYLFNR